MDKYCRPVLTIKEKVPQRSTFCFINTQQFYLKKDELVAIKQQWEKFEEVENFNSIVHSTLQNTLPVPQSNDQAKERIWYQFTSNAERQQYQQGKINHILEYPSVSDLQVGYADKPIVLNSTILTELSSMSISGFSDTCSGSQYVPPQKTYSQIISDRNALNLYVRVSTQKSLYPKSPYKFSSSQEYLSYKTYLALYCPNS